MTIIGIITSVVPASITGQGVDNPSLTGSSDMVTISVYLACFLRYNKGQKKSFHLAIRVTEAQEAIAGLITGRITLVNILKSPQPSILAASTSSSGTSEIY